MSVFFYKGIPSHFLEKLRPVRDQLDNLWNILVIVEAINFSQYCRVDGHFDGFDVAVFTKETHRFLVAKNDGYFSMANPFQVIIIEEDIYFNCDVMEEHVDGFFISVMRNAIQTVKDTYHSYEDIVLSISDNFGLDFAQATKYYDAFTSLVSDDHGYFRFDDDMNNENGNIHPRYHFDIFYKNSTSIKIGYDKFAEFDCFLSLTDKNKDKKYLLDAIKFK